MNYLDFKQHTVECTTSLENLLKESILYNGKHSSSTKRREQMDKVSHIREQVENNSFSVGVVGVFNSGKSTFLNALMGQKILSDFILPETASITTLHYAEKEHVQVRFWNADEWALIEAEAEKDKEVSKRLEELKKQMGSSYTKYISKEGRVDHITLSDLPKYTAANTDNNVSVLVKEVSVHRPLEFCKDNISIVDTPGLNDPMKMREMITTKYFLPKCDLVLFLLPANQAFTNFDKEFLVKQAQAKTLHKMFFLVSKVDELRRKKDIPVVVQFAKQEVQKALSDTQVDTSNLEVFPITAYEALLHRDAQYAQEEGDSPQWELEETGMLTFEKRLREFLYEGERAKEQQKIISARLFSEMGHFHTLLSDKKKVLSGSIEDAKKDVEQKNIEIKEFNKELERLEKNAQNALRIFEGSYDIATKELREDIQDLQGDIEKFSSDLLDEYLSERGQVSAAKNLKDWCESTFIPELTKYIEEMTEQCVLAAKSSIEDASEIYLEDIKIAYDDFNQNISIGNEGLEAMREAGQEALIDAALNAAIGLAIRQALLLILGYLSASMAAVAIGVFAGPIGWAVLGVGALVGTLIGVNLKDKIRSKFYEKLPGALSEQLRNISKEISETMSSKKSGLLNEVKEAALKPARELKDNMQDRIDELQNNITLLEEQKVDTASLIASIDKETETINQLHKQYKESLI